MKITGKELLAIGFTEGKIIGDILGILNKNFSEKTPEDQMTFAKGVLASPEKFEEHEHFSEIAKALLQPPVIDETIALLDEKRDYKIYGAEAIEAGARQQMEIAMKLPVTKMGALMPDAHQGYGLPIGGVLATENAVIPYGVGMDIGCRMCLTLYDIPTTVIETKKDELKKMLMDNTRFGIATFKNPIDDAVLENTLFDEIKTVKDLKDRAYRQIGTSGGGNHFVEFGVVKISDKNNEFDLPTGDYLGILSHSGSRGFGAMIAKHYTKLAMSKCKLPREAKHLAWLDLATEEGQEYWLAMNLAGDYASACHHQIHRRLAAALGEQPLTMVENHHNFAWKEKDAAGNDIIVHRKGATPAGKGVLGIIPGSMTSPGFIVRGKGEAASINSASHGAGRQMSRTAAKNSLDKSAVTDFIRKAGVEVIGSGLDESPMAYKDIHKVMASQEDLVEVIGSFSPKIVRMCGEEKFHESN